ncbi:MAG: flagellar basal body P-ring formation chaperone FlgA [Dyella sp.]
MNRRAALLCSALALILSTATLHAAPTTGPQIRAAAEQAVRAQYSKDGGRVVIVPEQLDPRLRLNSCPRALVAKLPARQTPTSRVSVAISCPGSGGWVIHVPVQMQVYRQVLVTTRPLARGDSLGPGDVRNEERDVSQLGYGYIENLDQVAGRSVARPLNAGSVLTPGQLSSRQVVRNGDEVQLVAQLDGIEVRTAATALGGGDTGERLRVRNAHSGRIIDGVVLGAGEVRALP